MIHIIQKSKFKHPLRVHFTGEGVVLLKDIIVKGKYRKRKSQPLGEVINVIIQDALVEFSKKYKDINSPDAQELHNEIDRRKK